MAQQNMWKSEGYKDGYIDHFFSSMISFPSSLSADGTNKFSKNATCANLVICFCLGCDNKNLGVLLGDMNKNE